MMGIIRPDFLLNLNSCTIQARLSVTSRLLSGAQMKKRLCLIFILTACFISLAGATLAGNNENLARESTEKGWRYVQIGDLETGLKRFRQANILDPDYAAGYHGVGHIYNIQNRLGLAIKYYLKAIDRAESPDPKMYTECGRALIRNKAQQEGVQMLQKALEIDPGYGAAHLSLSSYYCSEHLIQNASEHLEQARKLGEQPTPQLIKAIREECQ